MLGQVVNWMPQNDVLGHRQTRAFLSQCGANSLYEVRHAPDAPCYLVLRPWVMSPTSHISCQGMHRGYLT